MGLAQDKKGWELALDYLQSQVEEYRTRLDKTKAILTRRTGADERMLARITPPIPAARAQGYGVLPEIVADQAIVDVALHRNTFSISNLTSRAAPIWRDGFQLVAQAETGELATLVPEFERLRGHLSWAQAQISYHRYWQKAVLEHERFFKLRNRIVEDAELLRRLVTDKGDAKEIERLRTLIEAKIAPFQKTAGLVVRAGHDGALELLVHVVTDIADVAFLSTFEKAVDTAFNQSAAARAKRFRIRLTIERLDAKKLGVPKHGTAVDEDAHVARFPKGKLVLTTGAKSTHAFVGHYIQFGVNPMRPRELAHEFGHLLGFSDAYLRGFEGQPDGKLGCTLVEYGGLQDDLMGSPRQGRVTARMIKRLLDAYR